MLGLRALMPMERAAAAYQGSAFNFTRGAALLWRATFRLGFARLTARFDILTPLQRTPDAVTPDQNMSKAAFRAGRVATKA